MFSILIFYMRHLVGQVFLPFGITSYLTGSGWVGFLYPRGVFCTLRKRSGAGFFHLRGGISEYTVE